MPQDKYSAVWVSHSSMGDFLKCPRAYYLHNMYKDPKTRRKINIVNPALALGVAVHEAVEGLAKFKAEDRFKKPVKESFATAWKKVSGKWGGFSDSVEEKEAYLRGLSMIERVEKNKEPLLHKTIKIKNGHNDMPPNFYLSEEDNIILCGKIDWLIYKPEDDSVHILDFKTGKNEEKEGSLQLPIYLLLLNKLQKRKVTGASYWYLDKDDAPIEVSLPDSEEAFDKVYAVAKKIKESRERAIIEGVEETFKCPQGERGCFACTPFEKIIRGEATYVGVGELRQDIYMIP